MEKHECIKSLPKRQPLPRFGLTPPLPSKPTLALSPSIHSALPINISPQNTIEIFWSKLVKVEFIFE